MLEGDLLVGYIWMLVTVYKALPWSDRLDSAVNPVDGLSKNDMNGDWDLIDIEWPQELYTQLEQELEE